MKVRAKMRVESVTPNIGDDGCGTVVLRPVYDPDPTSENGQFYKWTPGGELRLSTINAAAMAQFEVDKEFYVDLTPAG